VLPSTWHMGGGTERPPRPVPEVKLLAFFGEEGPKGGAHDAGLRGEVRCGQFEHGVDLMVASTARKACSRRTEALIGRLWSLDRASGTPFLSSDLKEYKGAGTGISGGDAGQEPRFHAHAPRSSFHPRLLCAVLPILAMTMARHDHGGCPPYASSPCHGVGAPRHPPTHLYPEPHRLRDRGVRNRGR
jgi:hypothetical protein